jgi:hypothetical protein
MELDEIKKLWSEIDTLKEKLQVSDNKIKGMLVNEGKTALAKLIRMPQIGRIIIIPLGLLLCLLSYKFFEAGGYYMLCPLIFLLFCIVMLPFDIYLYRLLKGIDFASMTVREVSERILKFQNITRKFEMYGIIGAIVYLGIWYFLYYKLIFGSEIIWGFIIFMIVMVVIVGLLIPFLYKKLYYSHINRIKENLAELKEFEE